MPSRTPKARSSPWCALSQLTDETAPPGRAPNIGERVRLSSLDLGSFGYPQILPLKAGFAKHLLETPAESRIYPFVAQAGDIVLRLRRNINASR